MGQTEQKRALACAVRAARLAGNLMRTNLRTPKRVNSATQHDIKLELDVRCQKLIEKTLLSAFPKCALLGEEGVAGDPKADARWVVDPIDGTVNFAYEIPHACVSIALQIRDEKATTADGYATIVGVVYDPFTGELWTAIRGQKARLNGRVIRVSPRRKLNETIISLGFAKSKASLDEMLPTFLKLVHRVRKMRIMGAAALAMVYVASGRFDAYIEGGIRLWDIAAGGLILEEAGGEFWHEPVKSEHTYRIIANNGLVRRLLPSFV